MIGLVLLWWPQSHRESGQPANEAGEPHAEHRPWTERMLARGSGRVAFLVGIVLNLVPGLLAVVGYKDIARLDVDSGAAIALVIGFNVVMFTLIELPLIGYLAAPSWTAERVQCLNDSLRRHGRR